MRSQSPHGVRGPPQAPVASSGFPAVAFLQESPPDLLTRCEVDETARSRTTTQTLHHRHPERWSSHVPGPPQLFVLLFVHKALEREENWLQCLILESLTSPVCIYTFAGFRPLYSLQPVLPIPFAVTLSHASMGFILPNTCCSIFLFPSGV